MRKTMFIILCIAMLFALASCTQKVTDGLGTVSFAQSRTRDLFASISYPDANSLLWDITATKLSGGSTVGQGTTEGALLTDTFGPYSTGRWEFSLVGKDGQGNTVYTGSTVALIAQGENALTVDVSPAGETGTVLFENCNFPQNMGVGTQFTGFQVYIDGERRLGFNTMGATRNGNLYTVADQSIELSAGLHDVYVELTGSEQREYQNFKVRVEGGLTTTVSFGTFEGTNTFTVNVTVNEAVE